MKASEALKKLREKGSLDEMIGMIMGDPLKRAIEALEREADAEEKAKPKVTLKDQVDVVASARCEGFEVQLKAAADTIRRLDEEGGKLLSRKHPSSDDWPDAVELLVSLGVEQDL